MAIAFLDNFAACIQGPLAPSSLTLRMRRQDAVALNNVGVGGYVYLQLEDRVVGEVVKYTHTADIPAGVGIVEVPVDRDAGGTGAKNFPCLTKVCFRINSVVLVDYVNQQIAAGTP